jgi:hypothetical protein
MGDDFFFMIAGVNDGFEYLYLLIGYLRTAKPTDQFFGFT